MGTVLYVKCYKYMYLFSICMPFHALSQLSAWV